MATKTVINTSMPQATQRGISIIIDQDQTQKPQEIQLDIKRQWQQPQQLSPELKTSHNKSNDVEVSMFSSSEISPKFPAQTKTFIDINRNNVQINDHYGLSDSQNHVDNKQHNDDDDDNVDDIKLKETSNTTTIQETSSTFLHFVQTASTQQNFGERGKLALTIVGEKIEITKTKNVAPTVDNVNNVCGILVGKSSIQMHDVVAPIDVGLSVSETNEESTNRSNNGTTIGGIDGVQQTTTKALNVGIKKTIIQCNVENDNDNANNVKNEHNDEHDYHNEESVRICDGYGIGVAGGDGNGDADDVGQLLCNGLCIVDINSQQQSKLNDVSPAPSNISRQTKADCASAAKQIFEYDAENPSHVVKIQIKPITEAVNTNLKTDKQVTVVQVFESPIKQLNIQNEITETEIVDKADLSLNLAKMVQKPSAQNPHNNSITSGNTTVTELNVSNPTYLYYTMSSGQFSPCDTLDSGTGSDLESNGTTTCAPTTTTQSSKNLIGVNGGNGGAPKLELHLKTTKIRVNNGAAKSSNKQNGEHQRAGSLTDSEESESSSLSCDSLHSTEYVRQLSTSPSAKMSPKSNKSSKMLSSFLPDSLLRDIRDRKFPTNDFEVKYGNQAQHEETVETVETVKTVNAQKFAEEAAEHAKFLQECNERDSDTTNGKRSSLPPCKTFILNSENGTFVDTKMNSMPRKYEADKYYNFHVNEHENFHSFGHSNGNTGSLQHDDETSLLEYDIKSINDDDFAGYKDIRCSSATSTIRSSKGTVRGVKNRVRNGIATFLQMQQPHVKNFMEKDLGKVVLYTTSMGIIRDTYAKCSNVKQILRTLLVKFEERDVFMSVEYQAEIKNRMHTDMIRVPQLFVEGQHIGDAETVERLNESGELRQLLKPYKSISTTYTCQTCGGYRLLPCPSCNGSKKSVHRNHFTAEFVALKCMNCDEVGLVKCHNC